MANIKSKLVQHGSHDYQKLVDLRYLILRKPLKLKFSPLELASEKHDTLVATFEDNELVACCILSRIDDQKIKLRQMAVSASRQRSGLGRITLKFAEEFAKDCGYRTVVMHARETAVGFYEKSGYIRSGDFFTEVNIPHVMMQREL